MSDRRRDRGGAPHDGTQPLDVQGVRASFGAPYAAVDHAGKTRPIDIDKLGLDLPPEPEPEPEPEPAGTTSPLDTIQQRRRGEIAPPVAPRPKAQRSARPGHGGHRGPSLGPDAAEKRVLELLRADRPVEALRVAAELRNDPAAPVRARFHYLMLVCHVRAAQNLGETVDRPTLPIAWRDHLAELMRALDSVNPVPPKR